MDNLLFLNKLVDDPYIDIESDAMQFICCLYNLGAVDYNINSFRYKLFCSKNFSGVKLPPTLDAALLHVTRVAYQTFIWKNSATPVLNLPLPAKNVSWKYDENGLLCHKFIGRNSVSNEIIELVTCKCKSGCSMNRCVCFKASLKCTDAYLCINCSNKVPGVDDFNSDDDDDENVL